VNWKGFFSRVLLIAIAFPVLATLIFLLPNLYHLGFNIVVIAATVIGAFETAALFRVRGIPTSRWFAPILSGTFPLVAYLEIAGLIPPGSLFLWITLSFGVLFVRAIVFQRSATLASILAFVSSSFFTLLYPAFFLTYLVRLSSLPSPALNILFFLCIVFGNDMSAYFVGSLWGSSTRLNLAVSPQKSVLGFLAGITGSLVVVLIFHALTPGYPPFGLPMNLLVGLILGVLTILGDLIESGLKRSAGVKDSGIIIPGRGGMLDSVDSMLLSAPLFYYLLTMAPR
jgi:phosphatidate cytidylyltransferase